MKRFIRYISLLLVILVLFPIAALAAEEATPWASNYFMGSSVFLYKTSNTSFEAWFDVKAVRSMDELGVSVIKIQRSSDGENWSTMQTFKKELYPYLICEDTIRHAECVSYTGTKGYYYRAYIELYAKDSSGTGYMPRYTSSILLS